MREMNHIGDADGHANQDEAQGCLLEALNLHGQVHMRARRVFQV